MMNRTFLRRSRNVSFCISFQVEFSKRWPHSLSVSGSLDQSRKCIEVWCSIWNQSIFFPLVETNSDNDEHRWASRLIELINCKCMQREEGGHIPVDHWVISTGKHDCCTQYSGEARVNDCHRNCHVEFLALFTVLVINLPLWSFQHLAPITPALYSKRKGICNLTWQYRFEFNYSEVGKGWFPVGSNPWHV